MATKKKSTKAAKKADNTLSVEAQKGEDRDDKLASVAIRPGVRHAALSSSFANQMFGDSHQPSIGRDSKVMADLMAKAEEGDNALASRMLAVQAVTLDAMFTELGRRSVMNIGEYLGAAESYMRLALKAQANSRATLEALSKLHQPREQTVKHVHVNEGGKAVVADQFHQHTGAGKNGKSNKQPHATGKTSESAALSSPDPIGQTVPVSGGEGKEAVPNARGER